MNLISRSLLAALAFSIAAVPLAEAQARDYGARFDRHHAQPVKPHPHVYKRYEKSWHHWNKGQRVSDWKRRAVVRDWHHHGLKRPARGQQWIKVDNDYLLISVANGIIAGIVAGW